MTAKGVRAYRAANPGSKLKTAVTGKVKKGSAAAKRRKSYCARSLGQLKRSSAKTRNDPNSRIKTSKKTLEMLDRLIYRFCGFLDDSSIAFVETYAIKMTEWCWHSRVNIT
jgi:hypothetical protein